MGDEHGLRKLRTLLERLSDGAHYIFGPRDFGPMFPELSHAALTMLMRRAVLDGLLINPCRGIYVYGKARAPRGLLLYHAAARLRASTFNYISLESALSDAGVISQVPLQWLTLMSGGRSSIVRCGDYGTIEFVHTSRIPESLVGRVVRDERYGLWRAGVALAIEDMRRCKRSLDLIDWDAVHESL